MGAALSIFVIMSLSVFIIRLASVALRFTGLTEESARFQALSAFSGAGFTTRESEIVVNYPVRRRIISLLIVIGNLGLVTVFATLVVSLVHTDGEVRAIVTQVTWLILGLGLLWFLMLNKTADRILCAWIGKYLESTTILGKRGFYRLVQVSDGYSVCEHPLPEHLREVVADGLADELKRRELVLLGAWSADGDEFDSSTSILTSGHRLVLFGPDPAHDTLAGYSDGE